MSVAIENVPKGRLGVWFLIAGEIVIFGGFIGCYVLSRLEFPEFGSHEAAGALSLLIGTINTAILLVSNITMTLATKAAAEKNIEKMKQFMLMTIALGVVFLIIKLGIEWRADIAEGHTIVSSAAIASAEAGGEVMKVSLFWSYYYLMTGFHGLHILVGMLTIFGVYLSTSKGQNLHRVELAGLYWYLIEFVWVILFPMFYLIK